MAGLSSRGGLALPSRRALLIAAAALPVARAAAGEPGFALNFSGAKLLDQDGRRFDFAPLAGKVLLVNFVYTGCSTACPIQTRALAEVQAKLAPAVRDGIRFVSVSLDPLQDTPAALKAFATSMGADLARWSFVTGRPADVDRIAQRLRLFRGDRAKRPDDHATALWLVDARGRLVQRYAGSPPDVARLVRELTALHELGRGPAS